jgi:hypothetical protein
MLENKEKTVSPQQFGNCRHMHGSYEVEHFFSMHALVGTDINIKGSLTRDFRLQVFFMNQCPPGSLVLPWGRFEFFRKFAEIFWNKCLSPVSTILAINCSPVSTIPGINPCHGVLVIAGVVDTSDKFIAGDNNAGD